jgi:hypothetical protein
VALILSAIIAKKWPIVWIFPKITELMRTVKRRTSDQQVTGSSPVGRAIFFINSYTHTHTHSTLLLRAAADDDTSSSRKVKGAYGGKRDRVEANGRHAAETL